MDDLNLIELTNQSAIARISPSFGASIHSLEVNGRSALRPITQNPPKILDMGCQILAPFSNRIINGFTFEGTHYDLPALIDGEALPIHGDAMHRAWQITAQSETALELELQNGATGPYAYHAHCVYELESHALRAKLTLTNQGPKLPFGMGFHPWFAKDATTKLQFSSPSYWTNDAQNLPFELVETRKGSALDFSKLKAVPDGFIYTVHQNWDGKAQIQQGADFQSVELSASPALDCLVFYTPATDSGFVCLEPVGHVVNAINMKDTPGMKILEQGQSIFGEMTIRWV